MTDYKQIFIKNKANEIPSDCKEKINKYLPFYKDINSDDLSYIFAYLHYKFNDLFQFMNEKMTKGRHYNADESRELIALIDNKEQLSKELQSTKYSFNINDSYLKIISDCNNFLVASGGSPIPEEIEKLNIIESSPIFYMSNNSTFEENIIFDEEHIHKQWKKALERKKNDPEGAITTARTLIESILKYILDEKKITYNENSDLSEIYKEVAKSLKLAPEQHQEQIFKQILGGANGIISGIGSLRNKLGDAHGKAKTSIKPKERHSELAVNIAGTMALFLYKTFKEENYV